MGQESPFERVTPAVDERGNAVDRPWVIVLSDWLPERAKELTRSIEAIFERADAVSRFPLVFVVDDVGCRTAGQREFLAEHRKRLTDLTQAGAIILEPEIDGEVDRVLNDPLGFAVQQFAAAMQAAPATVAGPVSSGDYHDWLKRVVPPPVQVAATSLSGPSDPDGYLEFAKAFTRLSPEDLESMVNRSND